MTKNEKISDSLKCFYAVHGHPGAGRPGWKQSEEQKRNLSEKIKAHFDKKGRKTEEQIRKRKLANVQAYYARKRAAVLPDTDFALIRVIYEHCPEGYHVDHIQALARGGKHHQDNLQYLPASENIRKNADNKYDMSLVIRWQDTIPR